MSEKNNFQDFQDFAKRETLAFAREHQDEDTARLLLSASRYPAIDMAAAVQQIEGLRTAKEKWPGLLECEEFLYPPRLNREQASSEATARHKGEIITPPCPPQGGTGEGSLQGGTEEGSLQGGTGEGSLQGGTKEGPTIADLTGGMGIDTLAFARVAEHVDYVERDPSLCSLMTHNLHALGIENVTVHCADSMEWLATTGHVDWLFIDPARRDTHGRKVAAFEDCTPNILEHAALMRAHSRQLMVKASPMIDIDLACRQLGDVAEVHIVGVKGECKEVLFVCGTPCDEPQIICGPLTFTRKEESATEGRYCQTVGRYLYEPDATLMKGGPFKLIAQHYGLDQLGRNTHLYTSDRRVDDFPGRVFEVLQELKLSRKEVATVLPDGKAHVVTRNYPVEAAALQRQLGLKEGGEEFVIATTIGTLKKGFLAKCEK